MAEYTDLARVIANGRKSVVALKLAEIAATTDTDISMTIGKDDGGALMFVALFSARDEQKLALLVEAFRAMTAPAAEHNVGTVKAR